MWSHKYRFILQSFGLQTLKPRLFIPGNPLTTDNLDRDYPESGDIEPLTLSGHPSPKSLLGTPVFSFIELKTKTNTSSIRIDTVLIDIAMRKNIIRTAIAGRNGTVKEYISDDDYEITLRGMLTSAVAEQYPEEEVNTLIDLLKLQEPLEVVSEYIQLFGIYDMVVDSYRFPQREGFQNIQLFEIKAYSDEPIELKYHV